MPQRYIPKLYNLNELIKATNIYSLSSDLVLITNTVNIRTYRWTKIKLSSDFINSVVPGSIKVFISPYNSPRYGPIIQYRIEKNYIKIYTNAYNKSNSRYAKLFLLILGERWDTSVVNKIDKTIKR